MPDLVSSEMSELSSSYMEAEGWSAVGVYYCIGLTKSSRLECPGVSRRWVLMPYYSLFSYLGLFTIVSMQNIRN